MTSLQAPRHEDSPGRSGLRVIYFACTSWPPSRRMAEHVEAAVAGAAPLDVIDVWDNPQSVVDHEVLTVPTVVVTADGTEVFRHAGLAGRTRVAKLLTPVLDATRRRGLHRVVGAESATQSIM